MEYNRDNSGGNDPNSPETQGVQQNSSHMVNATPETAQGQLPSLLSLRLHQSPTSPFSMPHSDVGTMNYTRPPATKQPHEAFIAATVGQESGGNYNARSGKDKLGREAYGKYQVMDFNIPSWTKQFYGKSLTPEQFLADRQAQDAVGRGRLKELFDKYGVEDGASYYFSGGPLAKNANKKDKSGKTVASYVADIKARFQKELAKGVGPQVAAAAATMPESKPLPSLLSLRLQKPFSYNPVLDNENQSEAFVKGVRELVLGTRPKTYGEAKDRGLMPLDPKVMHLPPDTPVPDDAKFLDSFGMMGSMKNVENGAFKGAKNLTTKTLEDLKGRATVSKQYILDATNRPDLKQPERDLIRKALENEPNNINVPDFADKVQSELLPLKRNTGGNMYEGVTLPDELRGPVADYSDHIYSSPIKTSAGDVHFSRGFDQETGSAGAPNYFAHTRIEDLPADLPKGSRSFNGVKGYVTPEGKSGEITNNGTTRRVIEIQSDLFQKGRMETEGGDRNFGGAEEMYKIAQKRGDEASMARHSATMESLKPKMDARKAELSKLEPYRNSWHERVIREEIKQAAKDGKTKLQFPTGETAMKIEGLGEVNNAWVDTTHERKVSWNMLPELKPETMKVGMQIEQHNLPGKWIITDVLGDGKFKAVQRDSLDHLSEQLSELGHGGPDDTIAAIAKKDKAVLDLLDTEQFDISGKIDTGNPIFKFYEKEVGKYLQKKYGATLITDAQGVRWWELNVPKDAAKLPVEAFGAAMIPLLAPKKENNDKMK